MRLCLLTLPDKNILLPSGVENLEENKSCFYFCTSSAPWEYAKSTRASFIRFSLGRLGPKWIFPHPSVAHSAQGDIDDSAEAKLIVNKMQPCICHGPGHMDIVSRSSGASGVSRVNSSLQSTP